MLLLSQVFARRHAAAAAGPKRAGRIAERRKETAKQESKLQYMEMEGSGSTGGCLFGTGGAVLSPGLLTFKTYISEVVLPTSDDDGFVVKVRRIRIPSPDLSF